MGEFRMPSLGADMEYATLVRWRVRPGERVSRGAVIAEVETQKGVVEAEAFESGVVDELLVEPGTRVPVGTVLARIADGNGAAAERASPPHELAPATPAPAIAPPPPPGLKAPLPQGPEPPIGRAIRASPAARRLAAAHGVELRELAGSGPDGAIGIADVERVLRKGTARARESTAVAGEAIAAATAPPVRVAAITPVARRMAEDLHVDLSRLTGTGPWGVITRADVRRAASAPAPTAAAPAAPAAPPSAPPSAPPDRTTAMRQAIAAAMSRSKREIPHYYLATEIDLSRAWHWLEQVNTERPVAERILPAALFVKAVSLALRETPDLNGFWTDGEFRPGEGIHPGIVITLRGGGLMAPALHDADALPLATLMHGLQDVVQRTRTGMLRSSELTDATITVTNLGDLGVQTLFGVIFPPQVALVGIGTVVERPWAEHGTVAVRPVVTVTLSADHRASDGRRGARFLSTVARLLQTPEQL